MDGVLEMRGAPISGISSFMDDPWRLNSLHLLALAVWREARGEPWMGKLAVAQVIVERRDDLDRWPDTIEGVILQPKQFSAFNPGDANAGEFPRPEPWSQWPDCVRAAETALARGGAGWANHYHRSDIRPDWHDDAAVVAEIGAHTFLKL